MSGEGPAVYRVERSLRFGGGDRHDVGDLLIDPPEWVPARLERNLTRLDERGRIPRRDLRSMHYSHLRALAAQGDVDDVDGNSEMEAIIDAYALDEED